MQTAGRQAATKADAHVGSRVKMRRTMLGMSQQTLAQALGVTFQQVQKYEQGKNRIGAGRLLVIADALLVTPAFFFQGLSQSGTPADGKADLAARFFALPGAVDLAQDFLQIPLKADRDALANAVRIVANACISMRIEEAQERRHG